MYLCICSLSPSHHLFIALFIHFLPFILPSFSVSLSQQVLWMYVRKVSLMPAQPDGVYYDILVSHACTHTHTHWYYCVTWWARQCSVIFALSLRCPLVLFYFFIAHTQSLIGVCSWSIDNRVKQFTLLIVSREKNYMIPADTGGFFKKRMTHRRKRASSQEFISVYITCECRPGQGASGRKAKLFF